MGWKQLDECFRRFCWRGFTLVSFCPSCMTPLIPLSEGLEIARLSVMGRWSEVKNIFSRMPNAAGFTLFIPRDEETAQLLEYRAVVYPLCYACILDLECPGFFERVEQNLILSRRLFKIIKIEDDGEAEQNERG